MKSYLQWLAYAALISLLFIAVPLSYSRSKSKEEMKLQFDDYIEKFNKTYRNDPAEYETRFKHFMVSLDEIDKLNSLSRGPEQHRARYGLTRLSDMSQTEYKDLHLSDEKLTKAPEVYGRSWEEINVQGSRHHQSVISRKKRASLPLQVDWRLKGVVGGVQSQGMCGACWAFSTVGVIEAMAAISTGKLVPLSVQEAIDCAGLGNSGCAGGDICLLLDWLVKTDAPLETAKEYPLKLTNGTCKLPKTAAGVRVASFTCNNFVNAEDKILQALATHGPVAVAVNALTWQNYLGGVIQYHCSGLPTDLNHAVDLVGYDLTSEVPYYIAKNSWGDDFGLGGYLKLAVGSNICGLGNEVATVDVK